MNFDRLHMLGQVNERIDDLATKHLDDYFTEVKSYEARLNAWKTTTADKLAQELMRLAQLAQQGLPVGRSMLLEVLNTELPFGGRYNISEPQPPLAFKAPPELLALKAFLECARTPTLTTNALDHAGFRNFRAILGGR